MIAADGIFEYSQLEKYKKSLELFDADNKDKQGWKFNRVLFEMEKTPIEDKKLIEVRCINIWRGTLDNDLKKNMQQYLINVIEEQMRRIKEALKEVGVDIG